MYAKYNLNELTLSYFRIDYFGNIFNILISLILLAGFISLGYSKKSIDKIKINFILVLMTVGIVSTLIAYGITKFELLGKEGFIFNIPVRKAYTGFLMLFSLFLSIYVLMYVWGIILGSEKLFELRTLLRTLSAFFLLFIFALFYVWNVNSFSENKIDGKKFKYGFIPGAAVYSKGKPSPIFEARIRKAFELFEKNEIENFILTGGNAPGEITEAEAAYKYLINLRVNPKNIVIENETSTTTEQVKFIKSSRLSNDDENKILVISDGFHLTRVLQICKFFKVPAMGVSSDYSLSFEKTIFYRTREGIALLLFWFFAI